MGKLEKESEHFRFREGASLFVDQHTFSLS